MYISPIGQSCDQDKADAPVSFDIKCLMSYLVFPVNRTE